MSEFKPDPNYLGSISKNKENTKKIAFRIKSYEYEGKTYSTIQISDEQMLEGRWRFVKTHDKFPYKSLDIPMSKFAIERLIDILNKAKERLPGAVQPVENKNENAPSGDEDPF